MNKEKVKKMREDVVEGPFAERDTYNFCYFFFQPRNKKKQKKLRPSMKMVFSQSTDIQREGGVNLVAFFFPCSPSTMLSVLFERKKNSKNQKKASKDTLEIQQQMVVVYSVCVVLIGNNAQKTQNARRRVQKMNKTKWSEMRMQVKRNDNELREPN